MKTLFQYYQMFLMTSAAVLMAGLFILILIGDNGLIELGENVSKRDELVESNRLKTERIVDLYQQIHRLKNDAAYIENVVRHELGVIEPSEIVVKIKAADNS